MQHPLHLFRYCPKCGSDKFTENDFKSKRCGECGFTYYFNPLAATVGIITNGKGEILVARRAKEPAKGTLDLPGGFCDSYETAEEGITREIEEETGLKGLILGKFIRVTDHPDFRNDQWHLKHTWWYSMTCQNDQETVPQTEEGITEIRWVEKSDLKELLQQTYPTIVEVFRSMGLSEKFLPSVKQNL